MPATFVVNNTLAPTSTANNTSVNASATSVQLIAANTSRLGVSIYNDSSVNLYVLLGTGTASNTSFSVILISGAYYETPYNYNGAIQGVWDSAVGMALVTELV